jgi:plasmid stabilization system protein ParE
MAFRVEFLPRARHDLEAIYLWLVEQAPLRGPEWLRGLERAVHSLSELPDRCAVARHLSTPSDTVRQMMYGRYPHVYKVYYHIVGQSVEIMHIRHGARRNARRFEVFD